MFTRCACHVQHACSTLRTKPRPQVYVRVRACVMYASVWYACSTANRSVSCGKHHPESEICVRVCVCVCGVPSRCACSTRLGGCASTDTNSHVAAHSVRTKPWKRHQTAAVSRLQLNFDFSPPFYFCSLKKMCSLISQ